MTITITPTKARPRDHALLWLTDEYTDLQQSAYLLTRADLQILVDAATKAMALMDAAAPPSGSTAQVC